MAATVTVTRTASEPHMAFEVSVDDGAGISRHAVTLRRACYERLHRPGESPEEFVARCFYFLLEREPKGSILESFDVSVISRYFPDFESKIGAR